MSSTAPNARPPKTNQPLGRSDRLFGGMPHRKLRPKWSDSTPNQGFPIQCFMTEETADVSGHGEGAILLDTTPRSTDTFGGVNFQCDSQIPEEEGQTVSATATNVATGKTSEFSANETVFQP